MAPLLVLVCYMSFPGDSDNIHYMVLKWGTLPFLFLWFCSSRIPMARLMAKFTKPNAQGIRASQAQLVPNPAR